MDTADFPVQFQLVFEPATLVASQAPLVDAVLSWRFSHEQHIDCILRFVIASATHLRLIVEHGFVPLDGMFNRTLAVQRGRHLRVYQAQFARKLLLEIYSTFYHFLSLYRPSVKFASNASVRIRVGVTHKWSQRSGASGLNTSSVLGRRCDGRFQRSTEWNFTRRSVIQSAWRIQFLNAKNLTFRIQSISGRLFSVSFILRLCLVAPSMHCF